MSITKISKLNIIQKNLIELARVNPQRVALICLYKLT